MTEQLWAALKSKTFWAGLGLFGLALYQATQGNYEEAWKSAGLGATAWGLRHAIAKQGSP